MPTAPPPNWQPTSRRLSDMMHVLLDVATALGTVREHQRLHEARLDRHGQRLASVEGRITSLQQTISTWNGSTPSPRCSDRPKTMTTTQPSTATSPMATAAAPDTLWQRTLQKLGREALKDFALWIVGRIGTLALPYLLPGALALLAWISPFGKALLRWGEPIWRLLGF